MMRPTAALAVAVMLALLSAPQAGASKSMPAAKKVNFAIYGDWGGAGGGSDPKVGAWMPGPHSCPSALNTAFYISIQGTPESDSSAVPTPGDESCVQTLCGGKSVDDQENCVRGLEQRQAAYLFNEVCQDKGCEFVINTSDNFYSDGCNSTSGSWGGTCAERFKAGFLDIYHTDKTPALKGLTWYGSLGNHDVLGYEDGIEQQIAYTKKDSRWYLPARWYAKTIGSGDTAINVVALHTSCFIDGYLDKSSAYSVVDEQQQCSTPAKRQEQLDFAEKALKEASNKPGWTVIVGHHPPFSGDQSYFESDGPGSAPESKAWERVKELVLKYKPVAFMSGHDHVIDYTKAKGFDTQFIISGAGSFTEPNDGGWNKTSGMVRGTKPDMLYSNVIMKGGKSYTGFVTGSVTAKEFEFEYYSINTAEEAQYTVTCMRKDGKKNNGYDCESKAGKNANYVKVNDYPKGIPYY